MCRVLGYGFGYLGIMYFDTAVGSYVSHVGLLVVGISVSCVVIRMMSIYVSYVGIILVCSRQICM